MKYCKRYHDVIEQFKLSCKFCSAGLFLFFSFLQETEKKGIFARNFVCIQPVLPPMLPMPQENSFVCNTEPYRNRKATQTALSP